MLAVPPPLAHPTSVESTKWVARMADKTAARAKDTRTAKNHSAGWCNGGRRVDGDESMRRSNATSRAGDVITSYAGNGGCWTDSWRGNGRQ